MRVMPIVKSKTSGNYLPLNDVDLPLFRHLCEGMIEVKDIAFYAPVFEIHDVAYWIADNEAAMQRRLGWDAAIAAMTPKQDKAYEYACYLFKLYAPQCAPLSDTVGVLTQIDNYIAGLHSPKQQSGEQAQLMEALQGLLKRYTDLANSGDAGFWDCEKEDEVIAARKALTTGNLQVNDTTEYKHISCGYNFIPNGDGTVRLEYYDSLDEKPDNGNLQVKVE